MGDGPYRFFRAEDGIRLRYGYWPCNGSGGKGTFVVLGGRTEFMEKYLETIRQINMRGFNAFSLDWRGQGLSDRMLADPTRGYIRSYDQYVADVTAFIEKIVRPDECSPLFALAHSMGANILLNYLGRFPNNFKKGILVAPMIGIRTAPLPEALARWSCRVMLRLGKGDCNIPSIHRGAAFNGSFANNSLTHDERRFQQTRKLLRDNPNLKVIGVTFGWLAASFDAVDTLQRPGFAQNISTSLLVVAAEDDRIVCNSSIDRFAAELPQHQMVWVDGAYHEILQESDAVQTEFWQAFDQFIAG